MRNKKLLKPIAIFLAVNLLLDTFFPSLAYALTGGPKQPEVQSFTPMGTSEMVDLFTGDFNYNIPLLDVGGYPINLSYNSSITMDQEASWTGLGWNLNVGVVNRSMRGLPDDFGGDVVTKEQNIKPNKTYGVSGGVGLEVFGILKANLGAGLSYNNYTGYGFEANIEPSIAAGIPSKGDDNVSLGVNFGLNLSASSESGVGINPNVSFIKEVKQAGEKKYATSINIGLPFNSRTGLQALTISGSHVEGKMYAYKTNSGENASRLQTQNSSNGGASISFATTTYTPQIQLPLNTFGLNYSATLGGELFGIHGNVTLSGFYSTQFLATKRQEIPAYGYMYSHKAENSYYGNALLDLNREKDGGFSKQTPNLPITNFTYDIYSVAGQGIAGQYRPFRGDMGTVYDNYSTVTGNNISFPGVEVGGGNAVHFGTNFSIVNTEGHSGKWSSSNNAGEVLKFRAPYEETGSGDPLYEPYYFKQLGEKTAETDPELFEMAGKYDAVRIGLGTGQDGSSRKTLERKDNDPNSISLTRNVRNKRQSRNQAIQIFNAEEAGAFGLETTISSYQMNNFEMDEKGRYNAKTSLERMSHPKHHISEMTALRPDGVRYVYGVPVYNHEQIETTFAIEGKGECSSGLIHYTSFDNSSSNHPDNTSDNNNGSNHYFEKVTTPEYATAYLLTAILSPDYMDMTGDGPSDDDLGTYTKFNYTKAVENYKWRVPFEKDKGSFNEGFKSQQYDNKASYLYGKKDVWYLHSIETRTHVAEFSLSRRKDGYGVTDENGGRGEETMMQLDRISLYPKQERKNSSNTATPIKTVYFEYDYSLCPGVPNNILNGGKLTLKKLYFSYGKSEKGKLSPYLFNYDGINPGYDLKGYDRWGNYKPNEPGTCDDVTDITTAEFPYVEQDKTLADIRSSAWSLTSIDLPSGGRINLEYESDDYAYVQDRDAMQMFTITGMGNDNDPGVNPVTDGSTAYLYSNNSEMPYLFFKLQNPINTTFEAASATVKKKYIKDIISSTLYFRFLVALDNNSAYEYVPGYVEVVDAGVANNKSASGYTHGFIKMKLVGIKTGGGGQQVNPISKAAWNFSQIYLPRLAKGKGEAGEDLDTTPLIGILEAILSAGKEIISFVEGPNQHLKEKNYGRKFVKNKSIIRLYNPDKRKFGGGLRIAKISLSDGWNNLSSHPSAKAYEYGQEYDYSIEENGEKISSGVAAYEPILGGDENPFRQPVLYSEGGFLAPKEDYYIEEPFGEMFFPGPTVGYRKVTVKSITPDNAKRTATGSVVHEFYTAKDFPTLTRQTSLLTKQYKPNPLFKLLKIDVKEFLTASQGYVVELNDMHGKPKAQWVYPEGKDEAITGIEYRYKTKLNMPNKLDNSVYTLRKNAASNQEFVEYQEVGVDYDFVTDMREQQTLITTSGMSGNLETFLVGIFPVLTGIVLPKYSQEKTRFRSAVVTKVIQRYGLIETVTAHDLGSKVAVRNIAYDSETGEVLLTETQNQFDDKIYNFTFPAHWAYDGMGPAYKNLGIATIGISDEFYVPGDQIYAIPSYSYNKSPIIAWITNNYGLKIKNQSGGILSDTDKVKILRSGRKNQQSIPVGNITSLKMPLHDRNNDGVFDYLSFSNIDVINAQASEFADNWSLFCECGFDPNSTFNEYYHGARGNWRLKRSYQYLTNRTQTRLNDNPQVRYDGIYNKFSSFWQSPQKGLFVDWLQNETDQNWIKTSEVTLVNSLGSELENKDALGRYSSAIYTYNSSLPVGVANNAKYKEIAFEGFEDHSFNECIEDHFNFRHKKMKYSSDHSHTGRYSIGLSPGNSHSIQKVIFPCDDNESISDGNEQRDVY